MHTWANVTERRNLQPELAVSVIIFAFSKKPADSNNTASSQLKTHSEALPYSIQIPLIERVREPFRGRYAIPGAPVQAALSLDDSAAEIFTRVTGLNGYQPQQLHTFGGLYRAACQRRTPGQDGLPPDISEDSLHVGSLRVVTVAYWSMVRLDDVDAAYQVAEADPRLSWWDIDDLPPLAFDHSHIIAQARQALREIELDELAHASLPSKFILADLRELVETIQGQQLDPGNFQRSIKNQPRIKATSEFLEGTKHRPPRLYTLESP